MDEERKPWERMIEQRESAKWFSRFDRFRLMKPWERSVAATFHEESSVKQRKNTSKVPGQWYKAAATWKWEERAAAWDKYRLDERDKQIAAKEAEVLSIEYAQRYERVKALDFQAHDGEKPYTDPDTGKIYQLWSNPDRLREWRGLLDDIAKETDGRVRQIKQEVTTNNEGAAEALFNKLAAFQQKELHEQAKS